MKVFFLILVALTLAPPLAMADESYPFLSYEQQQQEIDKFLDPSFDDFDSLKYLFQGSGGLKRLTWFFPHHDIPDDLIGYRLRPNTRSRHITRRDDQIIFDSTVTVNSYGFRKTPHEDDSSREKLAVLSGCSWAFGYGLDDDQTISSYIAELDPSYKSFNLGLQGRGPNVFIELIRRIPDELLHNLKTADLVYVYMTSHIDRSAGTLPSYAWLAETPFYQKGEDGRMKYIGPIKEAKPWRNVLLEFLLDYKWLWNFGGERIFPRMTQKDYDYVCDLIVEMKNVWQDRVPHGRFLVYVHPMSNPFPEFESCFEKRGLKTYRSHLTGIEAGGHIIKGDGHPNQRTNRVVAEQILEVLRQSKW